MLEVAEALEAGHISEMLDKVRAHLVCVSCVLCV